MLKKILLCLGLLGIAAQASSLNSQVYLGELFSKVRAGNIEAVKNLLDKDSKLIDKKGNFGTTALSIATSRGNMKLVQLLVEKYHAEVTLVAFSEAIKNNKPNLKILVKYLFDQKPALIKEKAFDGTSALSEAAYYGNMKLVQFLVDNGAEINSRALVRATANGRHNVEILNYLLDQKPELIDMADSYGLAPLSAAAYNGNLEAVQLLIKRGAKLTSDALFYAVENRSIGIIKLLLETDKELIKKKALGRKTALEQAVHNKYMDIVQLLVEKYHAEVTPDALFDAVSRHNANLEIVGYLLQQDSTLIKAKNENNETPLQVAEKTYNSKLVELLENFEREHFNEE